MTLYQRFLVAVLVGFIVLAGIHFLAYDRQAPGVGEYKQAPAIAKAAKLPTVTVPLPRGIKAIKHESLKKLKVPDEIKNDSTKHVTATATLSKSKGGYDVLSVTDDKGETRIMASEKPPAFFSVEHSGRVGLGVGYDSRHGQTSKVILEYTPVTILGVSAGVEAQGRVHPESRDAAVSAYAGILIFKAF